MVDPEGVSLVVPCRAEPAACSQTQQNSLFGWEKRCNGQTETQAAAGELQALGPQPVSPPLPEPGTQPLPSFFPFSS